MDVMATMRLLEALGLCRHEDPDLWFAGPGDHASRAKAVGVCLVCPVRNECLELALAFPGPGIWGGLSEAERKRLARRRVNA